MAKDPAFLFYSSDFLSGIQDLTMEERGQYITLLCLQHQKGHLSQKVILLAVGHAAADVMAKFRQDSAGLWYNIRLEEEIEKRKVHTDKQRERALEGWKKRKNDAAASTTAKAPALPLENENAIEDENVIEVKKKKECEIIFPFDSPAFKAMWSNWIEYRRQIKKPYKSDMAVQAALKNLSQYPEDVAIKMIEQSVSNQWQGIFELKQNNSNGTTKKRDSTAELMAGIQQRIMRDAKNGGFGGGF